MTVDTVVDCGTPPPATRNVSSNQQERVIARTTPNNVGAVAMIRVATPRDPGSDAIWKLREEPGLEPSTGEKCVGVLFPMAQVGTRHFSTEMAASKSIRSEIVQQYQQHCEERGR
jgi:hypothetical protein